MKSREIIELVMSKYDKMVDWCKAHPIQFKFYVCALLGTWLSGMIMSLFAGNPSIFLLAFYYGIFYKSGTGFLFTAILTGSMFLFVMSITNIKKQQHGAEDQMGRFTNSKYQTYGGAHFATKTELEGAYEKGKGYINLTKTAQESMNDGIPFGKTIDYHIAMKLYSSRNRNAIVFGGPGSGKTVGFVMGSVFAGIKQGMSLIVSDPKGELYAQTHKMARANGYTVKVFNSKDFRYSDGWDLLGCLPFEEIMFVAEQIIKSAKGNEAWDSFYDGGELNILRAIMYYVYLNVPPQERHFAKVYEILTTKSISEISEMFDALRYNEPDNPANVPWNSVRENERNLAGFVNGLLNKLTFFQNEYFQEMLKHDEIDLELPARQKCLYYIIMDDTIRTFEPITSLFVNQLLGHIIHYADKQPTRKCDVPVQFVLEEFANVGTIQNIQQILSTARGRDIGISMVIQSLPQLKDRYRGNAGTQWEELIGNCDWRVMLGTNDLSTADYFSKMIGTATVEVSSVKKTQRVVQVTDMRLDYNASESEGKRPLMQPDEIMTMDNAMGLLLVRGLGCIRYEKVPFYTQKFMLDELGDPEGIEGFDPAWLPCYNPKSSPYTERLNKRKEDQEKKKERERELAAKQSVTDESNIPVKKQVEQPKKNAPGKTEKAPDASKQEKPNMKKSGSDKPKHTDSKPKQNGTAVIKNGSHAETEEEKRLNQAAEKELKAQEALMENEAEDLLTGIDVIPEGHKDIPVVTKEVPAEEEEIEPAYESVPEITAEDMEVPGEDDILASVPVEQEKKPKGYSGGLKKAEGLGKTAGAGKGFASARSRGFNSARRDTEGGATGAKDV